LEKTYKWITVRWTLSKQHLAHFRHWSAPRHGHPARISISAITYPARWA
jgi:hypothetical protein